MKQCQLPMEQLHDYVDGELSDEMMEKTYEHVVSCPACQRHVDELRLITLRLEQMKDTHVPPLSSQFTNDVMGKIKEGKKPQPKKVRPTKRSIFRRYPFISAAAIFVLMMSALLFSEYRAPDEFAFTKQPNIIVEGETVIVPEGEVVEGDLIVRNGNLRIEGEVNGDVAVVKGEKYMASTAVVTGEVEEIDRAFDWLWYKIKRFFVPSTQTEKEGE